MAALTVWKFSTPSGADSALTKLEQLQGHALIQTSLSEDQDAKLRAAFANEG